MVPRSAAAATRRVECAIIALDAELGQQGRPTQSVLGGPQAVILALDAIEDILDRRMPAVGAFRWSRSAFSRVSLSTVTLCRAGRGDHSIPFASRIVWPEE